MQFQSPYNRGIFQNYLRDVLMPDDYSQLDEDQEIPFQPRYIQSVCLIGRSESIGCPVYEIRHESESDPRVSLSKESFKLISHYGQMHALVLYVSNASQNYRFSLITMTLNRIASGIQREYSNPRRYSYYLGPDSRVHTPEVYLIKKGRVTDIADLEARFSIEVVNKVFYQEIAVCFTELVGGERRIGGRTIHRESLLKLPGKPNNSVNHQKYQEFAVRLIGRLVFCWFLKKKKSENGIALIPERLLSSGGVDDYYYHNTLENLFFQILNTPAENRFSHFRQEPWSLIPFLNGGLFEPHYDDYYNPDELGVSRHINTLAVPDEWFTKLFQVFETYNFTIDENTTVDIELSIDPEMLGRIFENLLAEVNPETGETARKKTGSFYTPRPVVEYMVDESLKQVLVCKAGLSENQINQLLDYSREADLLNEDEKAKIIDVFHEIKIIDPACGSGAFPMGMLQKMLLVLQKADPDSRKWMMKQLAAIPNRMLRRELEKKLTLESRDYVHKLGLIQHSIYGIDIQPIAVEISRLRFFLSLIVDETIDDNQDNRGLRALPNLDFKFVCADSLVRLPEEESQLDEPQQRIFEDSFFEEFAKNVENYFAASDPPEKRELRGAIEALVREKVDEKFKRIMELSQFTRKASTRHKRQLAILEHTRLADLWQSYLNLFQDRPVGFFETKYFFPEVKDGFDIVIANPPYVRHEKIAHYKPVFQKQYACYKGTADLYVYFYERSFELLAEGGVLAFISSNKFFRAGYGDKLRGYLGGESRIHQIIDFGDAPVFDAIAYPCIIVLQKGRPVDNEARVLNWDPGQKLDDFSAVFKNRHFMIKQERLSSESWLLEPADVHRLLCKIRNAGVPLGEYVQGRFYYGIKTGLNEAFVVDGATKDRLIAEHASSAEVLKPFLRGRDVKRWRVAFQDLWLIFTRQGIDIDNYPAIKRYLENHKERLEPCPQGWNVERDGIWPGRKAGRYKWYEIQDSIDYWREFDEWKIVWGNLSQQPKFSFLGPGYYLNAPSVLVVSESKYLLGILNSSICKFVVSQNAATRQGGFLEYKPMYVSQVTIPESADKEQIEQIVTQLMAKDLPEEKRLSLESDLDNVVYEAYGLTDGEIGLVTVE